MLVAGASGYVLKDADGDEILHAVRQAVTGGGVLSPEVTPTVIDELTEALERERRRARQLEMAQDALLERAARRQELIARLGHELRTPVTVILGMAQTLAEGHCLPRRNGRDPRQPRRPGERARPARAPVRGRRGSRPHRMGRRDCRSRARSRADHDRVEVEAPEGPAMASLNRTAAQRILSELVENALAFSPAESPWSSRSRSAPPAPRCA